MTLRNDIKFSNMAFTISSLPCELLSQAFIKKNLSELRRVGVALSFAPDMLDTVNFVYTQKITDIFYQYKIPVEISIIKINLNEMCKIGKSNEHLTCWKLEYTNCDIRAADIITMRTLKKAGYLISIVVTSLANIPAAFALFKLTRQLCNYIAFIPDRYPPSQHLRLFVDTIVKIGEMTHIYFSDTLLELISMKREHLPPQCVDDKFSFWS